ncbi:MAG: tetratricopeptide repeat protein [bacterium]
MLEKSTLSGLSEVSRAKLLGALGQVLTAVGDYEEAASLLAEAVEIFKAIEPLEVSRAYNYLIHNRLRAGDLTKAQDLLFESEGWIEETDTYGKLFRAFYRAELDRRYKRPSPRPKLPEGYPGLIHPYAFALQAWARNLTHLAKDRKEAIEEAADRLEQVPAKGGVLEFLAHTYRVYKAVLLAEEDSFRKARKNWQTWLDQHGKSPFKHRYQQIPFELEEARTYMDELMDRIPYH